MSQRSQADVSEVLACASRAQCVISQLLVMSFTAQVIDGLPGFN